MVTVLGAGSWGTALAIVLADNGHHVRLWGQRQEQMDEINEKHTNENICQIFIFLRRLLVISILPKRLKELERLY